MPDTGAPWNIPYVAPSDLVRDYPSDSEDLADAIALGLSAAGGLKAIHTVELADTFSFTSTTYITVTGLSVTFTPESATNKLVVMASVPIGAQGAGAQNRMVMATIARDGTDLVVPTSPGSRGPAHLLVNYQGWTFGDASMPVWSWHQVITAGSTSSTTIDVRVRKNGSATGTGCVNQTFTDTDSASFSRGVATLTIFEVKA